MHMLIDTLFICTREKHACMPWMSFADKSSMLQYIAICERHSVTSVYRRHFKGNVRHPLRQEPYSNELPHWISPTFTYFPQLSYYSFFHYVCDTLTLSTRRLCVKWEMAVVKCRCIASCTQTHTSVISGVLTPLQVFRSQVCVLAAQRHVFSIAVCESWKRSLMLLQPPAQVIIPVRDKRGR